MWIFGLKHYKRKIKALEYKIDELEQFIEDLKARSGKEILNSIDRNTKEISEATKATHELLHKRYTD